MQQSDHLDGKGLLQERRRLTGVALGVQDAGHGVQVVRPVWFQGQGATAGAWLGSVTADATAPVAAQAVVVTSGGELEAYQDLAERVFEAIEGVIANDDVDTATADTPAPMVAQAEGHTCPVANRCTFIDSVAVDGDSLVVEWTAIGFEPSFEADFIHAHFFWDIYSADQAGTNAATFGVTQGAWEITKEQPFRSSGEIRVQNRPVPANQVCVTAGNFAHAVVDPLQFDCAPLPAGM